MSNTRRRRHMLVWRRYRVRCDKLVAGQDLTGQLLHAMHVTPGYFRAEGWDTANPHTDLRHGA